MSVGYFLKEGFSGFKRAKLSTATAITSLAIAVLLLGLLVRMGYNAYYLAQKMREMIVVEVFIKDVNAERLNQLKQNLTRRKEVKSIQFISKDEAKELFLASFGSEGNALANLNFLPASVKLTFKEDIRGEQIKALIQDVSKWTDVDEIRFDEAILNILESRIRTFGLIGAGLSLFILFMALLLVYNTIRLTIFSKQHIIRAMKLVGATKSFIRLPFLIEGLIQGIVGSFIASVGVIAVFEYLLPKYIEQLGVLAWPFGRWYYLIGLMLVFGSLLGLIGSRWATKKFIHAVKVSS